MYNDLSYRLQVMSKKHVNIEKYEKCTKVCSETEFWEVLRKDESLVTGEYFSEALILITSNLMPGPCNVFQSVNI